MRGWIDELRPPFTNTTEIISGRFLIVQSPGYQYGLMTMSLLFLYVGLATQLHADKIIVLSSQGPRQLGSEMYCRLG